MNYLDLALLLTEKNISDVRRNENADEGLIFNIKGVGTLEIGFSSCEGSIIFNDEFIED